MNHLRFQHYLSTGEYVPAEDAAPSRGGEPPRSPTSLAAHDKRFHPQGFDPEKDRCEFREKLAKQDESDIIATGSGSDEKPLVARDINGEHPVVRLVDLVKGKSRDELAKWLRSNKDAYVRLYHGTGAPAVLGGGGISRTSRNNQRTSQSSRGFVYLATDPAVARRYADMGYNGPTEVYSVDLKVSELKPDKDSLFFLRRSGAESSEFGDSLADSLYYTGNARVARDIMPYEMGKTGSKKGDEAEQTPDGGNADGDDATYMDAVNRGDTQAAAKMVQDAFSKRMGKVSPYVKESDSEKPRFFSRPSKPNRLGWCDAWTQLDDLAPDGDSVFFNLKNVWGPADGYQGEPYTEDMLEYAAKNFCDTMKKAGVNLNSANIIANFPRVAIEDFDLRTLIDEVGNEQFEKAMRKLGYDGFAALVDDRKVTAFDKSAIVPAAPIERDSDGNVVPLSKRVEAEFGREPTVDGNLNLTKIASLALAEDK